MSNEENTQEETQEQGEVETPNENNDGQNQLNDQDLKTALEQKKHWRSKHDELQKKYDELKGKVGADKSEANKTKESELDYAKEAFLEGRGIKHPEDKKIIYEESERLKMPLSDILAMDYMKSKLKDNKDQREAESAAPTGRGKGSSKTQASVDYWISKGKLPDDQELAQKVVAAKMKGDDSNRKFDPIE